MLPPMTSPSDPVHQSMPVTGEDTIAKSAIQEKVVRIRHPRSSSPAVLHCAVVCALLVCVGLAQVDANTIFETSVANAQCLEALAEAEKAGAEAEMTRTEAEKAVMQAGKG